MECRNGKNWSSKYQYLLKCLECEINIKYFVLFLVFNLRGSEGQTVLVKIPILAVEIVDGPPQKELITSGESLPKNGGHFSCVKAASDIFFWHSNSTVKYLKSGYVIYEQPLNLKFYNRD